VQQGFTKSCGCWNREQQSRNGKANKRHGHCRRGRPTHVTVEYTAYENAKARCTNPNHDAYSRYGGRGIQFKFKSFEQFLKAVGGPRPKGTTLGRIDGDKNYAPGNVEWQTWAEQIEERDHRKRKVAA